MYKINHFVKICQRIGKNRQLVQAGGGNISLKLDKENMLIKSSGTDLIRVNKKSGYGLVNYKIVQNYIKSLKNPNFSMKSEKEYNKVLLKNAKTKNSFRPSMETGFHALLGPAVIHTHPVLVNTIICSKDNIKIIRNIFNQKNFLWLPYKTPGIQLSQEISLSVKKNIKNTDEIILFLENHGLIVSAKNLDQCAISTKKIVNLIKSYFLRRNIRICDYEVFNKNNTNIKKFKSSLVGIFMRDANNKKLLEGHIFPDSVVYCSYGFSFNRTDPKKITLHNNGTVELPKKTSVHSKKIIETLIAIVYILLLIKQFSEPKYLSVQEVNKIKNMENEKYRQSVK